MGYDPLNDEWYIMNIPFSGRFKGIIGMTFIDIPMVIICRSWGIKASKYGYNRFNHSIVQDTWNCTLSIELSMVYDPFNGLSYIMNIEWNGYKWMVLETFPMDKGWFMVACWLLPFHVDIRTIQRDVFATNRNWFMGFLWKMDCLRATKINHKWGHHWIYDQFFRDIDGDMLWDI